MTATDSFYHYIQAISEALVSGSAAVNVYPIAVDTYDLDYFWEGQTLSMTSDNALLRPQLALRSETSSTGNGSVNQYVGQNDKELYNVVVDVLMAHNTLDAVEMQSVRTGYKQQIQEDTRRIKQCLEHAGNLSTTIAGDETGLASGCLYDGAWSTLQIDREQNIQLSRIRFKGVILISLG